MSVKKGHYAGTTSLTKKKKKKKKEKKNIQVGLFTILISYIIKNPISVQSVSNERTHERPIWPPTSLKYIHLLKNTLVTCSVCAITYVFMSQRTAEKSKMYFIFKFNCMTKSQCDWMCTRNTYGRAVKDIAFIELWMHLEMYLSACTENVRISS